MSAGNGLTGAEARAQREHELEVRRSAEHACALDFLVYGDGDDAPASTPWGSVVHVSHAERCVFGPRAACSRTYDPMPYDEAEPDARLYEGTGIGALYGLPGSEHVATELEGWKLKPRTVYE